MTTRLWLARLLSRAPRRPETFRLRLEALKGRLTPADFNIANGYVTGTGSADQSPVLISGTVVGRPHTRTAGPRPFEQLLCFDKALTIGWHVGSRASRDPLQLLGLLKERDSRGCRAPVQMGAAPGR